MTQQSTSLRPIASRSKTAGRQRGALCQRAWRYTSPSIGLERPKRAGANKAKCSLSKALSQHPDPRDRANGRVAPTKSQSTIFRSTSR